MMDVSDTKCWSDNFEEVPEKPSFTSKIIMIGLILFGICTTVNTILIYSFVNLLKKI